MHPVSTHLAISDCSSKHAVHITDVNKVQKTARIIALEEVIARSSCFTIRATVFVVRTSRRSGWRRTVRLTNQGLFGARSSSLRLQRTANQSVERKVNSRAKKSIAYLNAPFVHLFVRFFCGPARHHLFSLGDRLFAPRFARFPDPLHIDLHISHRINSVTSDLLRHTRTQHTVRRRTESRAVHTSNSSKPVLDVV